MTTETKIYLVRHGETEWNKQKRLQGHKDSPLTPNGIAQAYKTKKLLDELPIDHAYVSPLNRARSTIAIILEGRPLKVVVRPNLKEINLGAWEGKIRSETELSHPDEYLAFWKKPDAFKLAGAETFQALQDRVVEELEQLFREGDGKNIFVVSHWIAIKVALAHYSSTPLSELPTIADPKNAGVLCLSKRADHVSIQQ